VPREKPLILLVEDESQLRHLYMEHLLISGFDVIEAGNGADAISHTSKHFPDVVLMDLSMPVIDGFGAIEAILSEMAQTRVLVLSGSADPADIARAREVGAYGYLTKENIAGELVDRVLEAAA
jgi:CheY-like chemotaxis protein